MGRYQNQKTGLGLYAGKRTAFFNPVPKINLAN